MQLNLHIRSRLGILIAGGLLLAVVIVGLFLLLKKEPTDTEKRQTHLDYVVKVLDSYYDRYGVYPQPTARAETPEGIMHVWGYRSDTPALASCTVFQNEGGPDASASACGGDVHDARGNVIGWKGTLTAESARNSIDPDDITDTPLSDLVSTIPIDPGFFGNAALEPAGFGEYVYAVRMPEDGATGAGGAQYQIAATVSDAKTGVKTTTIRGNYFVASDEEHMPSSLIGPGIVFDDRGFPLPSQDRALHVLLDGQQEGTPNPALGEGERVLRTLNLKRKITLLSDAIDAREAVLPLIVSEQQEEDARADFAGIRTELESLRTRSEESEVNLDRIESDVLAQATALESALDAVIQGKEQAVAEVMTAGATKRGMVIEVLTDLMEEADALHKSVLSARDEVVKYLSGNGIEAQARSRATRTLEDLRDEIPSVAAALRRRGIGDLTPFHDEDAQAALDDVGATFPAHADAGATSDDSLLQTPSITVSTAVRDVELFYSDLLQLATEILSDLDNAGIEMEEIDDKLQRLAQAVPIEQETIATTLTGIVDTNTAEQARREFQDLLTSGESIAAITAAAQFSSQQGDFSALLFPASILEQVSLDREPGVPDLSSHEDALEATYKGIPYPLP